MKQKLTLFILALLTAMGAWAAITPGIVQGSQVTSAGGIVDGNKYVIRVSGGSYITEATSQYEAPNSQNALTANAIFTFHQSGEAWTVECEATGNYWGTLTGAATGTFAPAEAASAGSWTFTFNGNNIDFASGGYHINRSSGVLHGWGSTIALQIYNIEEVNLVTAIGDFSNNKAYYVTTADRGAWFVASGGTAITSTTKAGFAPSMSDVKQQFAFLTYGTTGVYHLYSISEKKFVSRGDEATNQRTKLTNELGDNVTLLTTANASYPFVVALQDGAYQMGISNGYDPAVITFWNDLNDGGNQVQIREVDDFDSAEAMAILEAAYSTTITVTYAVYDGETFVESLNVVQDKNSAVSVPAALQKNTWYYDYTPSGTIGETNCTITVARTYKAGVVPALSGLSNSKAYRLVTERGTFTTVDGALDNTAKSGSSYTVYNFAIVNYEDAYYLWSVQDSKFVAGNGTNLTETPTAITINALDEPLFKFQCGSNYLNCNTSSGGFFSTWSTTDGGNKVAIIEAADFDPTAALAILDEYFHPAYTVTYVVKDVGGNTIFTSDPVGTELGANITTLPAEYQRAFCTYNTVDVTISNPNTTVEFTATYTGLPFTLSPSYAEATWYNMNIRSTKYVSKGASEPYALAAATMSDKAEDAYRWAFAGNPYELVVYNKACESTYTLAKDGNNAVMREGTYKWTLCQNSNGFTLKVTGTDNTYVNDVNSTLGFWNNASAATDNGSTFRVEAVIDNYYDFVKAEVLPFIFDDPENLIGSDPAASIGKLFGISSSAAETIVSTYGAQLAAQSLTFSEYEAIVAAKDAGILYPADGFYFVKNVSTGKYLRAISLSTRGGVVADVSDPSAVPAAVIEVRTLGDKQYMLSNGGWFNWVLGTGYGTGYSGWVSPSNDKYVHWLASAPGRGAFGFGYGNAEGEYASYISQCFYTIYGDDNICIGTDGSTAAAQWIFEEATSVTIPFSGNIDGKSYATFSAPFDVTIGAGATIYTVELDEVNSEAVYTAVADNNIPAGAGVLLISDDAASSVTATINTGEAFPALVDNDLVGYYFATTFTYPTDKTSDWNLVLGNSAKSGIGFYKMNGTASANKAYLPYYHEAESSVKGFVLVPGDDDATSINEVRVKKEESSDCIFNLAGQRLNKIQKGINIVNGKKILK